MMPAKFSCPDEETLRRLHQGLIPEPRATLLRRHEKNCPKCGQTAQLFDANGPTKPVDAQAQAAGGAAVAQQPITEKIEEDTEKIDVSKLLAPAEKAGELGRLGPYRVL